ncbi:TPA: restriction endonuclease subunit S [Klebsiella aerogenes]|nr:restriction endonuclease subunit S [Klebsiella aerogenes]
MAKYKAYPEYKDSGVEWVDSIPSYWDVKPTFALCDASTQKNIDGAESNVLSLSYGNIISRDVETNFGLLPESFNTYQLINCGDVILRLTDLQNDKNSLRVGLAKQKGIITSAYLKLKANSNINPKFLYRLLHSYDTTKVFYGMGGGLRQSMKFEDFRRLPLLLPPYEEQVKISAFLDHETAKIDNLIEKQKQLIELLKEKRQAVISHAVTKGLNPDVPMKDSGVEWLGEVPKHWVPIQLGKVCYQVSDGPHFSPNYVDSGVLFISARNIKVNGWSLDDAKYITEKDYNEFSKRVIPEIGDVLYTKGGTTGIARTVDIEDKFQVWVHVAVLKILKDKAVPDFIAYSLNGTSCYAQSQLYTQGATNNDLGLTRLIKIWLALPPKKEQQEIVDALNSITKKYDVVIDNAMAAITILQERRTALISAAVTGKIDVRDWVAPDSQDVEAIQEATA